MVTINEITRKMTTCTDYSKFIVISIGTGAANVAKCGYTAKECSGWNMLSWLSHKDNTPIIDILNYSSAWLGDYDVSILFQSLDRENHYLRIQVGKYMHTCVTSMSLPVVDSESASMDTYTVQVTN